MSDNEQYDRGPVYNQAYANGYADGYKDGVHELHELAKAAGFESVTDAIEQAKIMEIELTEMLDEYVIPDAMRRLNERLNDRRRGQSASQSQSDCQSDSGFDSTEDGRADRHLRDAQGA